MVLFNGTAAIPLWLALSMLGYRKGKNYPLIWRSHCIDSKNIKMESFIQNLRVTILILVPWLTTDVFSGISPQNDTSPLLATRKLDLFAKEASFFFKIMLVRYFACSHENRKAQIFNNFQEVLFQMIKNNLILLSWG